MKLNEAEPSAAAPKVSGLAQTVGPNSLNGLPKTSLTFAAFALCLSAIFGKVLYDWSVFALNSDLYSHLLLIPFVSAYLIWLNRRALPLSPRPARRGALIPLIIGLAMLAGFWAARNAGWKLTETDYLAWNMMAFVSLLIAGACFFFGSALLRTIAFPVGFLFFAAPFPEFLMDGIVAVLQYGSAETAFLMLYASGMPLLRKGTHFMLPGPFQMEVAPQCSGIHSTLVLFIVSLVAGYMFLKRKWARAFLTSAVLPLALLRNGFRIFTIGQLCVEVNPALINSYIHKQGGPIFFALSLIPFFLLLLFLRKLEQK